MLPAILKWFDRLKQIAGASERQGKEIIKMIIAFLIHLLLTKRQDQILECVPSLQISAIFADFLYIMHEVNSGNANNLSKNYIKILSGSCADVFYYHTKNNYMDEFVHLQSKCILLNL